MSRMTTRDAAIIQAVDQFGQLTSGHIWHCYFDNTNKNSMDRVLKRLVALKLLARVERRLVGGNGGGSGQYVYQLGAVGHDFLDKRGKYVPQHRTVKQHMLEIADAYSEFFTAELDSKIRILNLLTEPNSHMDIQGTKVRPDLYIEFELVGQGEGRSLWIEVDRGFESLPVIAEMVKRYVHVFKYATKRDMERVPSVVFLVPDDRRKRSIESVVRREVEEELQYMFSVQLTDGFITSVT
ncbi:replication-relaxation family protein [Arthrobacter sp. M-10]|uniref:replication-relaxation family protein n=1 Tax=Arthrobacter sp. M-10 TaxID=3233037 RepID=UPI003F933417